MLAAVLGGVFLLLASASVADEPQPTEYVQLEMYAAVKAGDDINHPENLDLFDAAGLVNFLATHIVIETGKPPARTSRFQGVEAIVKYQMRVRNPRTSAVNVQCEFATFTQFDNGAVVGNNTDQFVQNGDLVGILSYRPPNGDPRFPLDASYYWFSLSGPCPNMPVGKKDSQDCVKYRPGLVPVNESQYVAGGLCQKSSETDDLPDGTPGCVYAVESQQVRLLDEVVGITRQDCGGRLCSNWEDFRQHCSNQTLQFTYDKITYCREYDFPGCVDTCTPDGAACDPSAEVGVPFWLGRCDPQRNAQRVAAIVQAFGGSTVESHYLTNPRCETYGPMCNQPLPDAGVAYCHRDQSGICDQCYIPGTTNPPPTPLQGQVHCRQDLFLGKLAQYQNAKPQCNSDCSGECSTATDADLCCLYIGKCTQTWKAGEWGECDADCGDGTKYRDVACPFEDLLGPCDESQKPENSTSCRGQRCKWDPTNFGDWGGCNNTCGFGNETRKPVCDCPKPCGDDECSESPLPALPVQRCYTHGSATDFCEQCPADGGACSACLDGFVLQDGSCKNHVRAVKAEFRVKAADGSSLDQDPLVAALGLAIQDLVKQVSNVTVQVASAAQQDQVIFTGRRLGRSTDAAVLKMALIALTEDNTDAGLNRTVARLASTNLTELAKLLPASVSSHGCNADTNCTVPAGLSVQSDGVPARLCPDGGSWQTVSGCSAPPPPPTTPSPGPGPDNGPGILVIGGIAAAAVLLVGAGVAIVGLRQGWWGNRQARGARAPLVNNSA